MQIFKYISLWACAICNIYGLPVITASTSIVEGYFNHIKHREFINLALTVDSFVKQRINTIKSSPILAKSGVETEEQKIDEINIAEDNPITTDVNELPNTEDTRKKK